MKKIFIYSLASMFAACLFSCADESAFYNANKSDEGVLNIATGVNAKVSAVNSRAISDDELSSLIEKLNIVVSKTNADGSKGAAIRFWNKENGFPTQTTGDNGFPQFTVSLASGSYIVEGWTGDSVPASFTDRFFKGETSATVDGSTTNVTLECKIANVAASVTYDEELASVLSSYQLSIGHMVDNLVFEGSKEEQEAKVGYFMMPKADKSLKWEFSGTTLKGEDYSTEGVINDVKPGYQYILKFKYNSSESQIGAGVITVEIDETEIVKESTFTLRTRPSFLGYEFDSDKQTSRYFEIGDDSPYTLTDDASENTNISVIVRSSGQITNVVFGSDYLTRKGILPTNIDIFGSANQTYYEQLNKAGIEFQNVETNAEKETSNFKITFTYTFLGSLEEGEYKFYVSATDVDYGTENKNQKSNSTNFVLVVSNDGAVIVKQPESEMNLYEDEVTLKGMVSKDNISEAGFFVREAASETPWESATYYAGTPVGRSSRAMATNTEYIATVTGLKAGVKYEYTVAYITDDAPDNKIAGNVTGTFTTLNPQLPNAGFEDWYMYNNKVWIPGTDYTNNFWDTGNHGSTTLGASYNITTSNSTYKHSGNYSACLKSQYIILKFAAGNVFLGKYLDTAGTDGVLGWGRPFPYRPKSMVLWVKYEPQKATSKTTKEKKLKVDEFDQGQIYIALTDNSTMNYTTKEMNENWSFIVKTKESERSLFDKDADHVIAYGEKIFTEATEGDDLIRVEISLDYRKQDVRPTYIIFIASASRFGDYFEGGDGSTMYIDDIQLVY